MNNQLKFEFYQEGNLRYDFKGGELSSDGGMLLVREFDEKIGFTKKIAKLISDSRNPELIDYEIIDMLRERLYFMIAGYEDCNDVSYLKKDKAFQVILKNITKKSKEIMASQPTLSRFENNIKWKDIKNIMRFMVKFWLDQYKKEPKTIIVDCDTTADPCHGHQQLSLFHGYYKQNMYHPLVISCNGQIIFSLLRPGRYHANKFTHFVLSFLIKMIKEKYPDTKIKFRADSGFASPKIYKLLEEENVEYVIALITNKVLKEKNKELINKAEKEYESNQQKSRLFQSFKYKADSWEKEKIVIAKAEYTDKGENNRFVVTNSTKEAEYLYSKFYCQRGESENNIKDFKEVFSVDRLSCHKFKANQLRMLLSTMAYQLIYYMQKVLRKTPFANMSIQSIRLNLFKVAVQVKQTSRKIWFHFCSAFPYQKYFRCIHQKIIYHSP
jgi:hypothetical protein